MFAVFISIVVILGFVMALVHGWTVPAIFLGLVLLCAICMGAEKKGVEDQE